MINYILEVSFCWLGFYLVYWLIFRKETFFQANRWYLLSTLVFALVIPLLSFPILDFGNSENLSFSEYLQPITVGLAAVEEVVEITITASALEPGLTWIKVLHWIYWAGLVVFGFRFLAGLSQILLLYSKAKVEGKGSHFLVQTQSVHLPFSFFSFLFWSEEVDYDEMDKEKIMRHELAHIRQRHSFDVILLEILSILFWCSPLIHFYNRALRNVHEYLADAAVLETTKTKQYGQLLLRQSQSGMQLALANNFIHSQLKKRIKMMTKNKSSKLAYLKYSLSIPILVLVMNIFSQKISLAQAVNNLKENTTVIAEKPMTGDPIYKVVHEMPRFPGCEEITDWEERKQCSQQKMLEFIYKNIKYPKEARENGVQGTNVIRFVIDEMGNVIMPELMRDIGGGTGEESLRVIGLMQKMQDKWTPGKLENGKAVKVYFNLPLKFKLEGKVKKSDKNKFVPPPPPPSLAKDHDMEVFKVVEDMPRFPGCEEITDRAERKKCSRQKMLGFIYKNIKYPKAASEAGIQGVVVVRFILDKNDGSILKPEILREIGGGCGDAALKVINSMPKWIPGKQRGKAVNVQFVLPVKFVLDPAVTSKVEPINIIGMAAQEKIERNKQLELQNFKAFPNPSSGRIALSFNGEQTSTKVTITDINGAKVFEENVSNFDGNYQKDIDLSKVAKGMYTITVIQKEQSFSQNLMIQ